MKERTLTVISLHTVTDPISKETMCYGHLLCDNVSFHSVGNNIREEHCDAIHLIDNSQM